MPEQGWVALPGGLPEHPIPKGELVSVPGWGLAPRSCSLGRARMGQDQCLGGRLLGWLATVPSPTLHLLSPPHP